MKKILVRDNFHLEYSEIADPIIHDDEVEIKVEASGVNFADIKIRNGYYPDKSKRNPEMGSEVCGVVTKTGRDAHRFAIGEKVFAVSHWGGGYAERIAVPEYTVRRLPVYLNAEQGAAFPVITQTAYHLLKTAVQIKSGDRVLIHSAGGGVGITLVQLAKIYGAEVTALSSSDERLTKAKSLGADFTINYSQTNYFEELKRVSQNGFNLIYDGNGGEFFPKNFDLLAISGKVIVFGNTAGEIPLFNPYKLVYSAHQLVGFSMRAITALPELYESTYAEILSLIKSGKLKIEIGHTLKLADAAKAHDLLLTRKNYGKVVLIP